MRKTFIVATLILLVSGLTTLPFSGWVAGDEPETTKDIGARVSRDVELTSDSFAPRLTREAGISISQESAAQGFSIDRSEIDELPVDSTIARFTGETDVAGPKLTDHKVRVVVLKDFDYVSVARPYGFTARYGDPRFTLILDDATGEVLYSLVTHRQLEATSDSLQSSK